MRTIAIVNQKGGCGKTTCAINLAAIYAKRGLRTLLVDMDPQSHCAAGLGVPEDQIEYSIGDALVCDLDRRFDPEQLRWEVTRNLDLAPSTMRLAGMEAPGGGLHELPDKDLRLEKLLAKMDDRYDLCLVDCPPTIGLLAFNALRAARETLIPVETGYFSLTGAEKQWKTIQRIIERIGRPIACHMLATMFNEESEVSKNILNTLRRRFAGQLVPRVIRLSETIREAACLGQPVIDYAPNSEANQDFVDLADWLEQHASPTMGQHRPGWGQDFIKNSQTIRFQKRTVQSIAPRTTDASPGSSDRASELVRRVQALNQRKISIELKNPPPPPPELAPNIDPEPIPERAPARTLSISPQMAPMPQSQTTITTTSVAPAQAKVVTVIGRQTLVEPKPSVVDVILPRTRLNPLDQRYVLRLKVPLNRQLPSSGPSEKRNEDVQERTLPPTGESHRKESCDFGVRSTSQGALFTQPANSGHTINIAGEFNGWSPTLTPLQWREDSGVFQALVDMPTGKYQYRLVIDGKWQADRYNEVEQVNEYGEPNSVLVVPEA